MVTEAEEAAQSERVRQVLFLAFGVKGEAEVTDETAKKRAQAALMVLIEALCRTGLVLGVDNPLSAAMFAGTIARGIALYPFTGMTRELDKLVGMFSKGKTN